MAGASVRALAASLAFGHETTMPRHAPKRVPGTAQQR